MHWLIESWSVLWHAGLTSIVLLFIMILYVRINGLRSFAKMSSIDFVTTITIGSVINSTIMSDSNSIIKGAIVVGFLLLLQTIFSSLKMKLPWFNKLAENQPLLLMRNGKFLYKNLEKSNVSKSDVVAKLREANAIDLNNVYAVVLETTGDISVLHGSKKTEPDSILLEGVKDSNRSD
ncbi:uncharacterized protein DUF421 [Balneicella halophila]|uniref:Uncharacterized protein DUF421 n=1 Tax=Balneicella halophila TaxID=1537566 RepID=A0A7L4URR6_BALHA|nr:YetF domain-containing protein [Balneicella halophila]PVX52450.1 uncharacterized protein DUF421 [Balneicella halophila]